MPTVVVSKEHLKIPDARMIDIYYEEKREKISNVKPAVPLIPKQGVILIPPRAPSVEEIRSVYFNQKERILNVRPAIPVNKKVHIYAPPAPSHEVVLEF